MQRIYFHERFKEIDMNQQDKIKLLAEKVFDCVTINDCRCFYHKSYLMMVCNWNPYEDRHDAGMLIEKADKDLSIEIWNGHRNGHQGQWRCRTSKKQDLQIGIYKSFNEYSKSFTKCVSEAIFKAYGLDINPEAGV